MIERISCKNFKSYEDIDLKFAPITVFLGPNNSGKSAILSSLRILAQTIKSNDPSTSLLLNGLMGDFGTYKDIIYGNNTKRHLSLNIYLSNKSKIRRFEHAGVRLSFKYRSQRKEVVIKSMELIADNKMLLMSKYSDEAENQSVERIGDYVVPSQEKRKFTRSVRWQNFLPRHIMYSSDFDDKEDEQSKSMYLLRKTSRVTFGIYNLLNEIEYVGAMRVPPSRTYLYSGEKRNSVGSSGENSSTILAMDSLKRGRKSKNIRDNVVQWLSGAGIASNIKIVDLSGRHYEVKLQHPETGEYQNFADVGYGNSQVIPVLVGGFNLNPGNVYIVEEPEIHLHPRAQAELGNFFHSLYERGIQSIVETHSEHMILRLQKLVANKDINCEDIIVYYVYSKDHKKQVVPLKLDEKGRFIGDWPEGFFPERLEEAKQISKIRFGE